MNQSISKALLSMTLASSMTLGLTACDERDVAVGAGLIGIGAGIIAIDKATDNNHRDRDHYRRPRNGIDNVDLVMNANAPPTGIDGGTIKEIVAQWSAAIALDFTPCRCMPKAMLFPKSHLWWNSGLKPTNLAMKGPKKF